jgi:hypothetical protein
VPRLDTVSRAKKAVMDRIRRADLGGHVGRTDVSIDGNSAHIRTPTRELRLTWRALVAHDIGPYVLLSHGGSDATIIPKRVLGTEAKVPEFLEQTAAWWRAGQLAVPERIADYLSDRDVACPGCRYNLRGARSDRCPECGKELSIESLMAAKQ